MFTFEQNRLSSFAFAFVATLHQCQRQPHTLRQKLLKLIFRAQGRYDVKIPHKLSLQSPHFYKQSTCEKVREVIFLIIHNHEDMLQEKLSQSN